MTTGKARGRTTVERAAPAGAAAREAAGQSGRAWHALDVEGVGALLGTDVACGLTDAEARRRLAHVGPNRVAEFHDAPLWRLALTQFGSLVVLLLLAASAVAAALGEVVEALAILAALLLNAAIGFTTEWRARRSLARLRALVVPTARVRRDDRVTTVPAPDLVPGDLVVLEAGAQVPADARLVRTAALRVDEASLTGESEPVHKDAGGRPSAGAPLAERATMVYLGTTLLAGSGVALVTATGVATELGRIGQLVALAGDRATPLERQIEHMARRLLVVALVISAVVALVGILHGQPLGLMLETAITLAVAAIPEGLPAVTAVALAAGVWRLARSGALVRRLPAVETLGSTTVICSDKTGTITENRMTVVRVALPGRAIDVDGDGAASRGRFTEDGRVVVPLDDADLARLFTVAALVNDAHAEVDGDRVRVHGDPTETALLVAAVKAGLAPTDLAARWPRVDDVPFSPVTRLMATVHETPDGGPALLVKGAPGATLDCCARVQTAHGPEPLDDDGRRRLRDENRALAAEGYRVLAVAWRPGGWPGERRIADLTFLGFVAIVDPIRAGVKDAIAQCRAAGIATIMLTGDQASTAEAVGRRLGLPPDAIRSRVSPEDKLELVATLQRRGEIVTMTGDGVNDAPALTRADIGVAMGRHGTDVAREAADLVLTDDDFTTIVRAVAQGRVIYANLRKVIHFLFTGNLSEILVIFVPILAGFASPLAPLQILWINLVTDILPAMALVRDPADPDVMRRPPRDPREGLLTLAFSIRMALEAVGLSAGVLAPYFWLLLYDGEAARANTVAFVGLVLLHPFQALHCRSARVPWWRLPPNRLVWAAVLTLVVVQWATVTWPPLAGLLGTVPLEPRDWGLVAVGAILPVALLELIKIRMRGE